MNTEKITSKSLMVSVLLSFTFIVVGEIFDIMNNDETIIWFGILFLILSPLIAVVVAMLSFIVNREWKWVITTMILVLISAIGMMLANIV